MAHIEYEDGDLEDMSVEELKQLFQQGAALLGFGRKVVGPSYDLQ